MQTNAVEAKGINQLEKWKKLQIVIIAVYPHKKKN